MEAAQAYVMLSRIQALSQLIILVAVCSKKIYSSAKALNELDRIANLAINTNNNKRIIVSCNIRSLNKHFKDFHSSPKVEYADAICLQETWLDPNRPNNFYIKGMELHLNSVGIGKGIATYFNDSYSFLMDVKKVKYQLTMIRSDKQDIINIYRSAGASSSQLLDDFKSMFDSERRTLLIGDLNICFLSEKNHPVLKALARLRFKQKVQRPTHELGRLIDYIFIYSPSLIGDAEVEVVQESPYFSDHDLLFVTEVTHSVIIFLNLHQCDIGFR